MSEAAPGHTDLMVTPESLAEWLIENPPPEDTSERPSEPQGGQTMTTPIGDHLKSKRRERHLTLRQVEAITNGAVSNAYLSQVETGHVKNPSAIMLYRLSVAYGIDYGELMEIAVGVREPEQRYCPTCGQPT